ncbi:hypothetical protein F9L33_12915 [Amylibacter sp. SFDW26]|uniref:hypothetical protein n=1 Tax=Amylibacter sp. SFDW26 TaxID=2652722 RepID=UPI001261DA55|nr:hypothetical protein [Amylibacter sp. SFDW26]KAB7613488.1 hypothetical protein F9L33_12915 [Amylibacter sp. SFDW26]
MRKFKIGLVLAGQYLSAITKDVIDAIFGNVRTLVIFRVGVTFQTKGGLHTVCGIDKTLFSQDCMGWWVQTHPCQQKVPLPVACC